MIKPMPHCDWTVLTCCQCWASVNY